MKKLFPFNTNEPVEVRFIDVYHAEAVYFVIAGLLLDHNIYNGFPAIEGEAMPNSIIDECNMGRNDLRTAGFESCAFVGV